MVALEEEFVAHFITVKMWKEVLRIIIIICFILLISKLQLYFPKLRYLFSATQKYKVQQKISLIPAHRFVMKGKQTRGDLSVCFLKWCPGQICNKKMSHQIYKKGFVNKWKSSDITTNSITKLGRGAKHHQCNSCFMIEIKRENLNMGCNWAKNWKSHLH